MVDVFDPFNLPKLAVLFVFSLSAVGCYMGNLRSGNLRDFFASGLSQRLFLFALLL